MVAYNYEEKTITKNINRTGTVEDLLIQLGITIQPGEEYKIYTPKLNDDIRSNKGNMLVIVEIKNNNKLTKITTTVNTSTFTPIFTNMLSTDIVDSISINDDEFAIETITEVYHDVV